jgi:hypothetical protein
MHAFGLGGLPLLFGDVFHRMQMDEGAFFVADDDVD